MSTSLLSSSFSLRSGCCCVLRRCGSGGSSSSSNAVAIRHQLRRGRTSKSPSSKDSLQLQTSSFSSTIKKKMLADVKSNNNIEIPTRDQLKVVALRAAIPMVSE